MVLKIRFPIMDEIVIIKLQGWNYIVIIVNQVVSERISVSTVAYEPTEDFAFISI